MRDNYKNGTFRFGHLENLSLVGTASEESGGFFPDVLDMLDEIPILSLVRLFGLVTPITLCFVPDSALGGQEHPA